MSDYKVPITTADTGTWWNIVPEYKYTIDPKYWEWKDVSGSVTIVNNNKKGDDDMRYLYEVILVNPKNDEFHMKTVVARSETSALMKVYNESAFSIENNVPFDDLKISCKVLMEWKRKETLKKAIETIKKAVE